MVATQPALASVSPFFIVRDLQETIAYYRDRLGFEAVHVSPDPHPFFAILRRDGVQFFVKAVGEGVEPLPNCVRHPWARWDAYIYTPDPDALAAELSGPVGASGIAAENNDDGLRGFAIQDPNGYVLFFGRPI